MRRSKFNPWLEFGLGGSFIAAAFLFAAYIGAPGPRWFIEFIGLM